MTTTIPQCFLVEGALVSDHPGEPNGFDIVPGPPGPELADGKPTLALWLQDGGSFLQLGSWWPIPEQATRTEVRRRYPDRVGSENAARLHPAVLSTGQTTLELSDGADGFEALRAVNPSGYPPYAAVFSVQLDDKQADLAVKAIIGTPGLLRIRYQAKLPVGTPATASISGEAPVEPPEDPAAWVDEALASGRITATFCTPYGLDAAALDHAVRAAAAREAAAGSGGEFSVTIARQAGGAVPIEPVSDIAGWFAPGTGRDHIHELSATTQPAPATDAANGRN